MSNYPATRTRETFANVGWTIISDVDNTMLFNNGELYALVDLDEMQIKFARIATFERWSISTEYVYDFTDFEDGTLTRAILYALKAYKKNMRAGGSAVALHRMGNDFLREFPA